MYLPTIPQLGFVINEDVTHASPGVGYKIFDKKPDRVLIYKNQNKSIVYIADLKIQEIITANKWMVQYRFQSGSYILIAYFKNNKEYFYITVS